MAWSASDSEALYRVEGWGEGFFAVGDEGELEVRVQGARPLSLWRLAEDLGQRGLKTPLLLRFPQLIGARLDALAEAFRTAMRERGYTGAFRGVYPIKVNQQRHVCEAVVKHSRRHHLGLEAGSKPELQIVLGLLDDPDAIIVCNGMKDAAYLRMALQSRKLGRNVIPVIEKPRELDRLRAVEAELDVQPIIGVRVRITSEGAGRWKSSSGDGAKFGLSVAELVELVDDLRAHGQLHWLRMLHFHIGSQVTDIRAFKAALREAGRLYTELVRLGAPMGYLDVGGGVGVDYTGSRTREPSSVNYGLQEYATDVVVAIADACDDAEVDHPVVVTEAGRAMVAHNSVLLVDVMDVRRPTPVDLPEEGPQAVRDMAQLVRNVLDGADPQESWHDAQALLVDTRVRFVHGLADVRERATVQRLYDRLCEALFEGDGVHAELEPLRRRLATTYYANFSLFQSAPDIWAIGQQFPVLPVHRLLERPRQRAVLADVTCDSDGCIRTSIDGSPLLLHPPGPGRYVLGIFLLGAYQEILGDLHNLYGDTHAVHVVADADGYHLDQVIEGDDVSDVLAYVQYSGAEFVERIRRQVEAAIADGVMSEHDGREFVQTYASQLGGYTYLG